MREREASLGRDRELMIVVCKKWHVAKRLVERVRALTGIPAVEYVFNEEATPLPDLGGIETTLEKRTRHRRALVRMLFERHGSDRLILCMDPADFELMRDFAADRATVRFLEVSCDFCDDYLAGHARRTGLAADTTPAGTLARLLPTVRGDIAHESERLRDAGFAHFHAIRQGAAAEENAVPLAAFLSIPVETAREIAATDHLFAD